MIHAILAVEYVFMFISCGERFQMTFRRLRR
jgi:hypothetical protein